MAADRANVPQAQAHQYVNVDAAFAVLNRPKVRSPDLARASREQWTTRFANRLAELRNDGNAGAMLSMGHQLFVCVGHFNPEIAAEMEHEIGRTNH